MKKLNRKGFTLVELLAVIIILAIVVGITIPAVLTTTNNAKKKAMTTAASSAADWVDRQYQVLSTGLDSTGIATLDSNFNTVYGAKTTGESPVSCMESTDGATITSTGSTSGCNITNSSFITAAGLKSTNLSGMTVFINSSTGRSCVKLTTAASGTNKGDYPDSATACGGVCSTEQCTAAGV